MANGREIDKAKHEGRARLKKDLDEDFNRFIGKRVLSAGHATREMDGRLIPFVLATVTTDDSQPVGGVSLELRDPDGKLLDTTRTSPGGVGILRELGLDEVRQMR